MTARTLARLQQSFKTMSPRMDALTGQFYANLFAARPDVRAMFPADMHAQRHHLGVALSLIVRNLGFLDALDGPIRDLGARHARFGTRPEHYPAVLDAMLLAMAQTLGPQWDDQLEHDWTHLLLSVAAKMIAGAGRPE